ncbi:unnamed protein product, partial [Prunus brigantina]
PAEDKVREAVVKLRTPVWCRPKALRYLISMWDFVRQSGASAGGCRFGRAFSFGEEEGVSALSFQASEGSLPKGSFVFIASRESSFQASEGSLPKGSCDIIASRESPSKLREGAFQREVLMSSRVTRVPSKLRKGAFRREVVMSSRVASPFKLRKGAFGREVLTSSRVTRVPSKLRKGAFRREVMSDNSKRESQSPPSPHTFSGEEFESGSHDEALAYREIQRNYVTLEACANRVLGITQAPEASASGRAGPSGCGTKNMMSLYDLESLKVDYAIPGCVGLRLPTPAEAARYPPKGCYNPNFWCILYRVYVAWWLAKRGEPTIKQFMHLYSMSRQQGNFGWAKERGYFIGQPPLSQKTWRNRWFFAFGDWECWPGKIVSKHVPTQFQSIGSVKCRPVSKEEEEKIELV